ncbi:MAG: GNAT family N-acetyltransferase [Flavobacteriaceae bacterium]
MFQTPRLYLRKISVLDAPFIFELLNSKEWLKYIGDRGIDSIEKAEAYIEKNYLPICKNGLGVFVVTLSSSHLSIGTCGLYQRDTLDHPDIGFAFLPEYIGKGYGFEAASAVVKYALENLKLASLYGFTLPENIPSIKLLEKLGLQNKGSFNLEGDEAELLLFKIINKKA